MLKQIKLHNFLSYKDCTIKDLSEMSMYAVIGENGAGKSAIFEAVYYALYGKGRASATRLIRDGSDDMSVEVLFQYHKDQIVVKRGRGLKSNLGFAEVRVNDKVEAHGSSVERWVSEYFSMDSGMFLLTSFFGLGATDQLMKVRASVRLETIQDIANVSIYTDSFYPLAKKKKSADKEKLLGIVSSIKALKASSVSVDSLLKELHEARDNLKKIEQNIDEQRSKQAILAGKHDKKRAYIREIEAINAKLFVESKMHLAKLKELQQCNKTIQQLTESANKSSTVLKSNKKFLRKSLNEGDLRESIRLLKQQVATKQVSIDLRKVVVNQSSESEKLECPLCHSVISKDTHVVWKEELTAFKKDVKSIQLQISEKEYNLQEIVDAENRCKDASESMQEYIEQIREEKKSLQLLRVEEQGSADAVLKWQTKLDIAQKRLNELKDSSVDIDLLDKKISLLQEDKGKAKQLIKTLLSDVKKAKQTNSGIDKLERNKRAYEKRVKAWNVVIDAFSRYGISADLIKGLCQAIESKATAIYRQFDAGQVVIEEVEDRGKPGVEFALYNRTGKRYYAELSEGQKVMVFMAVRLAITEILVHNGAGRGDFLILDEVMGHLSEKRRDELLVLIKKVLSKVFSQVFIISHAPVRNLFSNELLVSMNNGVSTVEEEKSA